MSYSRSERWSGEEKDDLGGAIFFFSRDEDLTTPCVLLFSRFVFMWCGRK